MIGIGTAANVAAIVAGGCIGLTLRGGLKEHYQQAIIRTLGLCTLFIGAAGALPGLVRVEGGSLAGVPMGQTLGMILSLALGTLLGERLDFEGKMERLGAWLKPRAAREGDSTFIQGFVSASLTVCIGAMAIVGALQDGLTGDHSTLFAKALLDGISAIIFGASLGIGVSFSAVAVFLYQGIIALLASFLSPFLGDAVIAEMTCVGSLLILVLGTNLLNVTKIKVMNLVPAVFFPILLCRIM